MEEDIWKGGVQCQWCKKSNTVRIDRNGNIMKYLCYDCSKTFRWCLEGYVNHRGEVI